MVRSGGANSGLVVPAGNAHVVEVGALALGLGERTGAHGPAALRATQYPARELPVPVSSAGGSTVVLEAVSRGVYPLSGYA